jgi:tetratricopeptide (TPR) repeat protein
MTIEFNPSKQCDDGTMSSVVQAMQLTDENGLKALNDTLASWPLDFRLWFLRGSIHAGQQQHEQARNDFVRTLALAPEFHVARFMLGLLELINTGTAEATVTWSPLDEMAEDDPFRVLKSGLLSLAHDQFDGALEHLNRGLALNQEHPLINAYIRQVVEQIALRSHQEQTHVTNPQAHESHLLLSGYHGNQTRH